MTRLTIQAVLCVALCPLLVAQQATGSGQSPTAPDLASAAQPKVATITLPRKTAVELALLKTVSSATAQKGQAVGLVVKRDVIVNGAVVIPRGTPASGLVTSVRRAIPRKSDGSLRIEPVGLTLPDGSSLELREYIDDGGDGVCEGFVGCMGLIVVAIPSLLPSAIASGVASFFKPHYRPERGLDQTLASCWTLWGSTKAKSRINGAVPNQGRFSPPNAEADSSCSVYAVPIPTLSPAWPKETIGDRTVTAP
jgi:hypothetical protein